MTYILVDTANTFFRARHAIRGDTSEKVGMAFHITLNGIRKAWRDFKGHHVVFCLEGRSWRKDFYAPYKRQRSEARAAHSPREVEEEKVGEKDRVKDEEGEGGGVNILHTQHLFHKYCVNWQKRVSFYCRSSPPSPTLLNTKGNYL